MTYSSDRVTVGRLTIPVDLAAAWLRAYLDAEKNQTSTRPYAYPAYDHYNEAGNDPDLISDADLLAPLLLNVKVSVRSFYALQQIRGVLENGLTGVPPDLTLAETTDADIATKVKPLYVVLDDHRPFGVWSTTLSKILHRKRPHFLVLHDKWVRSSYWGPDGPVLPVENRNSSDYVIAISQAIAKDVRNQQTLLDDIVDQVSNARDVSRVRLMDILAWTLQGKQP